MYPFPLAGEILKEPLEIDHGDLIVPRAKPQLRLSGFHALLSPWHPSV